VKNVFLHEDLLDDMYMEIPPDFGTNQTMDKGVTLNIFFDLSICKTILNFTICLVEFCAGINMQMN
jgi:hypothetical protein